MVVKGERYTATILSTNFTMLFSNKSTLGLLRNKKMKFCLINSQDLIKVSLFTYLNDTPKSCVPTPL